ncbi:MAG: hypothetical protein QNJ44_22430 [Rhodobacter sp.]|nr:hypothetical protein [Rhodobacter sp.]
MPHYFFMCIALVGVLFGALLTGFAYAQMKLRDPKKDGYFGLQNTIAGNIGLEKWAGFQRSKAARIASFLFALAFLVCCLALAVWQGFWGFS